MGKNKKWKSQFIVVALGQAISMLGSQKQRFVTEIKEGLQVFREDKKLFYIVIAEALCMFFYAPLSSFYPLMTSDYFDLSAMYGSAVELSFAIGMIVSSLLFSSVLKVERKIRVGAN